MSSTFPRVVTARPVLGRVCRVLVLFSRSDGSDARPIPVWRPSAATVARFFRIPHSLRKTYGARAVSEHDLDYWRGGTYAQREAADSRLKDCVANKTGNKALARLMYEGVRIGGSPYFYNWYRWGYGWSYERKYQALTPEERKLADSLVENYFATVKQPVCPL